jgi:serine/threonine-protein kinase
MNDSNSDFALTPDSLLARLTSAIADGLDVDWALVESNTTNPEELAIVRQLRVLADVGGVFKQSIADAPAPLPSSGATGADLSQPGIQADGERPELARWGPFEIRAKVGTGTFGTVYRAWDPGLEREVGVKLLHNVSSRSASRLVDEARLLARVRHSNIVTIFGADQFEGEVGFWMEFVNGRTLKQIHAEQGTCSAEEALLFGLDLCRALAAVHRAGFLHCDVKAQNVMRETGGRTVLMDFGAAALIHARTGSRSFIGGTPLYLAPEVLAGGAPSVRSDLYSLGVLLYFLVSGDFPVFGTTLRELNDAHAARKRRWLRDLRPELPAPFVRAVDDAIAVLPESRPDSAGAMEALLERAAGRSVSEMSRSMRVEREKPAQPSIAVLPFADLSPDKGLAYFCEGIAEELLEALRAVPGVRVVGRSSAFRFTSSVDDPRHVGTVLNVGSVLEGSVRTSGNRLRVVARLIDTEDGSQLWSERFDRQLDDVFAVQDEIAQASVRALGARFGGPELRTAPASGLAATTSSLEAYTLYLKGRFCWNQRTEPALKASAAYFEEAVKNDVNYASAHAGLADAYATLGLYGVLSPDNAMPKARAAAQRAIELAGTLSAPHATLACVTAVFDWNWRGAEAGYRRAIMLNSSDPVAHQWYAINHLVPLQRFDEAAEQLRLAKDADPLSTPIRVSGGIFSYFAHRFDEAEHQLRESLELDAGSSTARLFLGLSLVERGRHDSAIRELDVARELSPRPEMTAAVGYAYAKAGDVSGAHRALDDLHKLAGERYVSPSLIAQVHAGLEETRTALEWLERARECRAADLSWLAVRPVFDQLRREPEVARIIAALGL